MTTYIESGIYTNYTGQLPNILYYRIDKRAKEWNTELCKKDRGMIYDKNWKSRNLCNL